MDYEFLKQRIMDEQGFISFLPIEIDKIELGKIRARLLPKKSNANPFGTIHGGCYYAVADTIAGTTAMTHGHYVTTISGHIHYLKGATAEEALYIETVEIHAGKSVLTYDVLFTDETGTLVCKATLDYYALKPISEK